LAVIACGPLADLLVRCARLGVRLTVDGDRIRFDCPRGAVNDALRAELRRNKAALLELLRRADGDPADRVLAEGVERDGSTWTLYDPGDGSTPVRILFGADTAERAL
jgi:hypothetical protein